MESFATEGNMRSWPVWIVMTACAGGADFGGDFAPTVDGGTGGTPQCFSSSECPVGFVCSEFGTCVAPPPPPGDGGVTPPPEIEYRLTEPSSSRRYVWVAMTEQDRLAKIDGANLEVESFAVGDQPKVLATLPGTDTAVVLDSQNAAATVVSAGGGAIASDLYPTLPNLNRLAVAPGGRHAIAFFDLNKAILDAGSLEAVGEIGSFQDVTLLAVGPGSQRSVDLTVGFRPREVESDATGRFAFVVTDDGVSVIDLPAMTGNGPTIVPPVPIMESVFDDTTGVEVDIVASGLYAVVRRPNVAALRVVSLMGATAGDGFNLTLPAVPTDIDLAPDGSRVYAVFRDPAPGLAIIDIPGDALDPAGITFIDLATATGGSLVLSEDGKRGLLFTNATLDERITVIELDQPGFPHRTFPLQKSVLTAGFDPTGTKAIVLHARAPGDPEAATSFDEFIDRKPGYSVFDVASGFAKLQITEVNPRHFTFARPGARAYVTLDGGDAEGAVAAVQQIELDSGVVRTIELGSPPDSIGTLPDSNKIFVSQRHPLGRVTFIDITSNEVRTLTGFDLNSQIID
jgi:DNA-binding beta-propeller fold protein YncE